MKVIVGIPSFRRPALLADLLASLARQEGLDGATIEVFVADNDPERTEAVALCSRLAPGYRFPLSAAVVVAKGISAARNALLAEARSRPADLLAMIDDDETASPDWLSRLIATQDAYRADVVGGALLHSFEHITHEVLASGAFLRETRVSGPISVVYASGNVLLNCAALARLGWPRFDNGFGLTGGEDKEFFTRLKRAGASFAWSADAIAYETVPASRVNARAVLRRAYGIGNSDFRISARHGPAGASTLHLAKSAMVLAAALPLAPALLAPRWRLWLLRRYARALGRLAAALGRSSAHYGVTISP